MKKQIAAVFISAALFAGPVVAAESLHVMQGGIFNPGQVTSTGTPSGTFYSSVIQLKGVTTESNKAFDIWAFCVDLAHTINVGINSFANVNYTYTPQPLTQDGYGNALSAAQIQQISGLASLGFTVANGNEFGRDAKLAAIQGAIWEIEYGQSTISAANHHFPGLNALIDHYVDIAPTLTGRAQYIYAPNGQGLISSYVPEPSIWALLIAGFGMVGIASRRRSRSVVAA
jgi:hypothetical protein